MRIINLLFWMLSTLGYAATQVQFEGTAVDQRGRFAYREVHTHAIDRGKIVSSRVEYYDAAGTLLAEVESRFTTSPYQPDYKLFNYRRGKEESVTVAQDFIDIAIKRERSSFLQQRQLKLKPDTLIGEGLFFYLQDHLLDLEGRYLTAFLLVASRFRLAQVTFSLQRSKNEDEVIVDMHFSGFLERLFGGATKATFDKNNRRLLSYEGLSFLRDEKGGLQRVITRYSY